MSSFLALDLKSYNHNLNLKKKKKMDSEEDDFPKQGGEALELGEDFDSEEEADQIPAGANDAMRQPMKANIATSAQASGSGAKPKPADVKGDKVEDQPFDLAVDVNDSEEIDSEEEEDEVNVDMADQKAAQAAAKAAQNTQQ